MKFDLIIDGNYLLYKDTFILYGLKTLHKDLLELLKKDIETITNLYPFDNCYIVSDSIKNWRRTYYNGYKSTRKKDDKIDWDFVHGEFNTFLNDIKENNKKITHLQIDLAEGDDIIADIVQKNNTKGISNLILASDSDLHQLLKFNLADNYINMAYNYKFSDDRLYLPQNYQIFISELSKNFTNTIFDMSDDNEFLEFINIMETKTKIVEVSNEQLLFCKLISGDNGDAIPSVYQTMTKTGKIRGIGKTGSEKIYKLYKESFEGEIDFNSDVFVENVIDVISYDKKIDANDTEKKNEVKENIYRNRKLIILDNRYLPDVLLDNLNEKIII
jgi:5'-3' exonuclease